jgi:hypothetical protein
MDCQVGRRFGRDLGELLTAELAEDAEEFFVRIVCILLIIISLFG